MSERPDMPRNKEELAKLVNDLWGMEVKRGGLLEGHCGPLEYLEHAFFEMERQVKPADCVVWANRGGGKTMLGAVATALDLLFKPGITIRILGGSKEQSRRMQEYLASLLVREGLGQLVRKQTADRLVMEGGGSCEVLAQSETSVRGTRVQKLRCDELELFDVEVWNAAQLTTMSRKCGEVSVRAGIECFSTMHKVGGLMTTLVAEAKEGKRQLFKWGIVDSLAKCGIEHVCGHGKPPEEACALLPECDGKAKVRDEAGGAAGHLPVQDVIDQKKRVSLATWESEMLCLKPNASNRVFPEFNRDQHVVEALPRDRAGWRYRAGMDFGLRSATVILWAGVDPEGVVWVYDEWCETGAVVREAVEVIKAHQPVPGWIAVDPAGDNREMQSGKSNVEVMRRAGLKVRALRNRLLAGLESVRWRLQCGLKGLAPKLRVVQNCHTLIESLERYRYPHLQPQSETPEKDGNDHAADALRYLLQSIDAECSGVVEVKEYAA